MPTIRLTKLCLFLLVLMLSACKTSVDLSDLDWILGKWQINEGNSFEEWIKINNDLYQGKSYQVRGNTNVVSETIEITRKSGDVFYIPTVINQNEGKPVAFKLVSMSRTGFTFENKEHDFPQRIVYVKNGERQIDARIEGQRDGQFSKVDFQLHKADLLSPK